MRPSTSASHHHQPLFYNFHAGTFPARTEIVHHASLCDCKKPILPGLGDAWVSMQLDLTGSNHTSAIQFCEQALVPVFQAVFDEVGPGLVR